MIFLLKIGEIHLEKRELRGILDTNCLYLLFESNVMFHTIYFETVEVTIQTPLPSLSVEICF